MKKQKWCIIAHGIYDDEKAYLGWQNPAWNEDGYFWTTKETFNEILDNSTPEHPFLFNSKIEGIQFLKDGNISQQCKVVIFK